MLQQNSPRQGQKRAETRTEDDRRQQTATEGFPSFHADFARMSNLLPGGSGGQSPPHQTTRLVRNSSFTFRLAGFQPTNKPNSMSNILKIVFYPYSSPSSDVGGKREAPPSTGRPQNHPEQSQMHKQPTPEGFPSFHADSARESNCVTGGFRGAEPPASDYQTSQK